MSEGTPFGVEDGDVLVYRLFDVADAIDLAQEIGRAHV